MFDVNTPDDSTWTEIEPSDRVPIVKAYQRMRDGLVLGVEQVGDTFEIMTLPENYYNDYQAIESIATTTEQDHVETTLEQVMQQKQR